MHPLSQILIKINAEFFILFIESKTAWKLITLAKFWLPQNNRFSWVEQDNKISKLAWISHQKKCRTKNQILLLGKNNNKMFLIAKKNNFGKSFSRPWNNK